MYRNIVLPVLLSGLDTWSPTLREVRRLRVFENRETRRIFEPMRVEVTGEWRKLHNFEELNDLYSSPNIFLVIKSRRIRWAEHVASMGERRSSFRVLVGKPKRKRPFGRPGRRWEVSIKMATQKWDGGA